MGFMGTRLLLLIIRLHRGGGWRIFSIQFNRLSIARCVNLFIIHVHIDVDRVFIVTGTNHMHTGIGFGTHL